MNHFSGTPSIELFDDCNGTIAIVDIKADKNIASQKERKHCRARVTFWMVRAGAGRAAWFLVILTGPQGAPPALGTKIVTTQAIPTTLCIF